MSEILNATLVAEVFITLGTTMVFVEQVDDRADAVRAFVAGEG